MVMETTKSRWIGYGPMVRSTDSWTAFLTLGEAGAERSSCMIQGSL